MQKSKPLENIPVTAAVLQGKDLLAHRLDVIQVDLCRNKAGLIGGTGDHIAPGVDHHGVTVGLEAGLFADLARSNHIAAVFNGPGLEQRQPVVLAGIEGKVGRTKE